MTTANYDWQALAKGVSKVIAEAWLSKEVEARLLTDPDTLLKEKGYLPDGLTAKVDVGSNAWKIEPIAPQSSKAIMTIPFPPRPMDISDQQLQSHISDTTASVSCLPNC